MDQRFVPSSCALKPTDAGSLAWHLADIWVEELDKVLRKDSPVCPHSPCLISWLISLQAKAPIPALLHPFTQLIT
jgi:hypothetical protein